MNMVSDGKSANDFIEVGAAGISQFDGFVHEERLRQLSSPSRRYRVFREMMDNDPIVAAVLFTVDMLVRQVDWHVVPFSDDADAPVTEADQQSADFIWSALNDMQRPWREVVSEILSFLPFGWSYHELVLKFRSGPNPPAVVRDDGTEEPPPPPSRFKDGRVGWHKMAGRAQDTLHKWQFDSSGEILGMVQQAPPHYRQVFIPIEKALHFRTSAARNNPEGRSILRSAFRPWYFKKTFEEIQAVGIERDLAGLPVLSVPEDLMHAQSNLPAAQATLRGELEELVRNIRRGQQEGVLIPTRMDGTTGKNVYELKLLSSGGRRQFDIQAILEYYDRRIALMALADFMLLGHEKVGSFALADSKTDIFGLAMGTWLDVIAAPINTRAIPQLMRINGLDEERPPKLEHGDLETQDLGALGTYIQQLAGAGMPLFPDEELQQHLLNEAGLPSAMREV